jgi:hypothetical protein
MQIGLADCELPSLQLWRTCWKWLSVNAQFGIYCVKVYNNCKTMRNVHWNRNMGGSFSVLVTTSYLYTLQNNCLKPIKTSGYADSLFITPSFAARIKVWWCHLHTPSHNSLISTPKLDLTYSQVPRSEFRGWWCKLPWDISPWIWQATVS